MTGPHTFRIGIAALAASSLLTLLAGCGAERAAGPPAATAQGSPAASATPVFDAGFEAGDTGEWQPGEAGPAEVGAPADEAPSPTPEDPP
jgi:hypothetical protein